VIDRLDFVITQCIGTVSIHIGESFQDVIKGKFLVRGDETNGQIIATYRKLLNAD
jgi:hypothetical protein